jgi:hypothetical protein
VLDGYRGLVNAEYAGRLAGGGTDAAGELRKVIRRAEDLEGLPPVFLVDRVVELGDDVAERAAAVAEGDAAVHAPAGLGDGLLFGHGDVEFLPVGLADGDGALFGEFAGVLEEAFGVCHSFWF